MAIPSALPIMPAMDMGKYDETNPRDFSVDDFAF